MGGPYQKTIQLLLVKVIGQFFLCYQAQSAILEYISIFQCPFFGKVEKRCSLSYVYVLKSFSDIFLLFFFLLLLEVFFPKLVKQLSKVSPWSCKFC